MRKKRILLDLDVITVALWDAKGINFINRVKGGEFEVYTPHIMIELVSKWKNRSLSEKIIYFYELYTDKMLTAVNIFDRIKKLEIDDKKIIRELIEKGVKEEDAVLVLVSSIFDMDYLVTYNRKHLKNNEKEIMEVLSENGLKPIKIAIPDEI